MPVITQCPRFERALAPLLNEYTNSRTLPSQALENELPAARALAYALSNEPYITRYRDVEVVGDSLDAAFAVAAQQGAAAVATHFEQAVRAHSRDLVAIIPLDFSLALAATPGRGAATLGVQGWRIVPPRKSRAAFNRTTQSSYSAAAPIAPLLAHQNAMASNHLLQSPLLLFPVHGSVISSKGQAMDSYVRFKWLLDLYMARSQNQWRWRAVNHPPSNHFFLLDTINGYLHRNPLWSASFVPARFAMSELREFGRTYGKSYLPILLSAPTKLRQRFDNALKFLSRSVEDRDNLTRFLFAIISLEALFSRDKDAPIKSTLADYSALIAYPPGERRQKHQLVRELYNLRSSNVHSGVSSVPSDVADQAQTVVANVLHAGLKLLERFNAQPKPEELFFKHLLALKLA